MTYIVENYREDKVYHVPTKEAADTLIRELFAADPQLTGWIGIDGPYEEVPVERDSKNPVFWDGKISDTASPSSN